MSEDQEEGEGKGSGRRKKGGDRAEQQGERRGEGLEVKLLNLQKKPKPSWI